MFIARTLQRLMRRVQSSARAGQPARLSTELDATIKRLPDSHQKAAQGLTDWPTIRTVAHRNKVIKGNREGSHPDIIDFYKSLSAALDAKGMPFYGFEFLRDHERQGALYRQGFSKARPGQSPHNWGCAVDVIHTTRLWDLTKIEWAIIGAIGKEVARKRKIPIVWGGDWNFYDPAHWQLKDWKQVRSAAIHLEGKQKGFAALSDVQRFAMIADHIKPRAT